MVTYDPSTMSDGDGDGDGERRETRSVARAVGAQLIVPALIGLGTGACVAGASVLVEQVALESLARLPGGIPALFSLVALVATGLVTRYVTRTSHPATTEVYILAFRLPKDPKARISLRELPGRVLAAAATVSFGGSQGLESPSALIGASLGQIAGGWMRQRFSTEERRSWMVAGASAGIAAVFSSPGVGTLYGIEVPFRRDVDGPRLVPAAVGAACAYLARDGLIGARHLVTLDAAPTLDTRFALGCLLTALACGFGARLFALAALALHGAGERTPPWPRRVSAGVLLAALAWSGHALSGRWITFGPGYFAVNWVTSGDHALWLLATILVVRTAGTFICIYGGGGGGVFTSLACTGVFVGEIVARVVGRQEGNVLPILGSACFLGAGYRIPLAAMLLVAEMTGNPLLTAAGLAVVGIGQVLMGDGTVSDAQQAQRPAGEW
jgi:CIC family chloride channel protein